MFLEPDAQQVSNELRGDMRGAAGCLVNLFKIAFACAFSITSTAEVFLREDFGPKYLLYTAFVTLACLWLYGTVYPDYNEAFGVFVLFYAAAILFHLIVFFSTPGPSSSRSPGMLPMARWHRLWPARSLSTRTVVFLLEPGTTLLAGMVLSSVAPMVGHWLIVVAACLFLKAMVVGAVQAHSVQNAVDQQIQADDFDEAVQAATESPGDRAIYEASVVEIHYPPPPDDGRRP